jgi:four helix bundle protein
MAEGSRVCAEVYALTAAFPKHETYGLSLQMRRAAVSIAANIAEGFRRRGKADKARFLNIAEGSVEAGSLARTPPPF